MYDMQISKMRDEMQQQQKQLMFELANLKNDAKNVRYENSNAYNDYSKLKQNIQASNGLTIVMNHNQSKDGRVPSYLQTNEY